MSANWSSMKPLKIPSDPPESEFDVFHIDTVETRVLEFLPSRFGKSFAVQSTEKVVEATFPLDMIQNGPTDLTGVDVLDPTDGNVLGDLTTASVLQVPTSGFLPTSSTFWVVPDISTSFIVPSIPTSTFLTGLLYMASVYRSTTPTRTRAPILLVLGSSLGMVDAVCPHCKDSISGCAGGDECPLFKDLTANAAIFAETKLGSTPRMQNVLPPEIGVHFSRPMCEAIVAVACAPKVGHTVDFDSTTYTSTQAVVQAATYGHCSVAEAACELAKRLEAAETGVAVDKIKGAIDSLKIAGEGVASSTQGVLAFIWAKVSNIAPKRASGVVKIVTTSIKNRAAELSSSLVRPKIETEFFEMIHLFHMVIIGLGLYTGVIVMRFIDDRRIAHPRQAHQPGLHSHHRRPVRARLALAPSRAPTV